MKEQRIIVWLALGALLVVVLNLPNRVSRQVKSSVREGLAPLQRVLAGGTRKVTDAAQAVRGLGGLVGENQRMASELVRLRGDVRRLKSLETENILLREQLEFVSRGRRSLVPAEVIARDISGWWQSLRLGKGAIDGIEENMAVVTLDGLVGRTVSVSPRTSDVLLLSDAKCKVSARISRTGAYGVLTGRGSYRKGAVTCQLDFINKNAPVRPGDEVVTSGLGGSFPKGLLIGYIDHVELDASGLYQQGWVVPKADLGGLNYVFVVSEDKDPVREVPGARGLPADEVGR